MKVRLLAFASAADAIGSGERDFELPDGCDVAGLLRSLEDAFPRLAPLWPRLAVAVAGKLVERTERLYEGAEVALLPPVSGGSPDVAVASTAAMLVEGPLELSAVVAQVSGQARGALVVFVGTVRGDHQQQAIEKLTYAAYRPMALSALEKIVGELEGENPSLRVAIRHRLGEVPVGEASVVIAVAAPHRAAAYEVSRRALERLKAEVPIWKREHFVSGDAVWRENEPLAQH